MKHQPHPPITVSPCHPITVSPCPPITVSPCHPVTVSPCRHPPTRLFTWWAHDNTLCIGCCACGEILAGAAHLDNPNPETTA